MDGDEMTKAEQISARFGDDGQCWEISTWSSDDVETVVTIDEMCAREGFKEYRDGFGTDVVRYEFSDGSAIVFAGEGWDVEGTTPYSWAGCEQSPPVG